MMFDATITIGNIIEITAILGGGMIALFALKAEVGRLREGQHSLHSTISKMEEEIKKLGEVLIKMAGLQGEIKVLETRLHSVEQDIRDVQDFSRLQK